MERPEGCVTFYFAETSAAELTRMNKLKVSRQVTKSLLFLFISLFSRELSRVSEAEQKHTNRLAVNDKNLRVLPGPPQIAPPFLIISPSLFLKAHVTSSTYLVWGTDEFAES